MTNFEKVTAIVVEDIKNDLRDYEDCEVNCWQDILDLFGIDGAEMKENIYYLLTREVNDCNLTDFFTDDLDIIDEDGTIWAYRQLTNAVRKQLF